MTYTNLKLIITKQNNVEVRYSCVFDSNFKFILGPKLYRHKKNKSYHLLYRKSEKEPFCNIGPKFNDVKRLKRYVNVMSRLLPLF